MMMKEKYSKLQTDRISVALAPLMVESKVRLKARKGNTEWKEVDESNTLNYDFDTNDQNSAKGSFWETEF